MRRTFWEKRIPTLFGIFLITIGAIATSFFVRTSLNFIGRATPTETPENIRITNVSDNSFTVSYKTQDSVPGSIFYGKEKTLGSNAIDDRDQQAGNLNSYKMHSIALKNLKPSTRYYFAIISGQTTFLKDDEPFMVTTGPTLETQPQETQPIVGRVVSLDGSKAEESVIYLTTQDAQTISALVKNDGKYILPLNSMRNNDLNSYLEISLDSILQMLVVGTSGESSVTIKAKQINSVPVITLSKNYDFTIDSPKVASLSASIGFPSFSASASASKSPQILTPKKDEAFSDQKPLFKGTALPGADVKITINSSQELKTQIKADSKGNWSFRPQTSLAPGLHTVSIETRDQSGILKKLIQSFTVYAQGSQVEQPATPSATPTLRPSLSPSPTISVLPSPTLTPTPILTATPIPTQIPTITPVITILPSPIQQPGNSSLLITGITVIAPTIIGIILFIITRGSSSL